ncbi:MAG: CcdB family protein [Gammaproteobacteria bacterium]|nr:CcdB family protein [Gammaproteobacteria bacterium]
MPQFAVYQNRNFYSSQSFPLLVDVQSALLDELGTRVVVPLARAEARNDFVLRVLMPPVELEGKRYVLMTPQITGLSRAVLGPMRGSLAAHERAISMATDLLLRGFVAH